jgi:hypothetical protein
VLADRAVVGRIFNVHAAPVGTPWMWTLAFGHHEDRTPTHGYEPTREAAMGIIQSARPTVLGENNSSLEMARVDERTLDNNSLGIPTLSYPRKRHRARTLGHLVGKPERPRFRGTNFTECQGDIIPA